MTPVYRTTLFGKHPETGNWCVYRTWCSEEQEGVIWTAELPGSRELSEAEARARAAGMFAEQQADHQLLEAWQCGLRQ